jgi:uncharacterized membrane protein YjgN (DUF898 family)
MVASTQKAFNMDAVLGWLKTVALAALAVLAPIHPLLIVVGILIFADVILGIMAARKRKEEITSAGMRRTVTKMLVYQLAIITGFLLETYLLDGVIPVAKLVAGTIGIVEFKSIIENTTAITDVDFKKLMKLLGSDNDK